MAGRAREEGTEEWPKELDVEALLVVQSDSAAGPESLALGVELKSDRFEFAALESAGAAEGLSLSVAAVSRNAVTGLLVAGPNRPRN